MSREEAQSPAQTNPFETALFSVSHCLTEAEAKAECGLFRQASHLLRLAETQALRSGYLELVSLVWVYDGVISRFACLAPPGA